MATAALGQGVQLAPAVAHDPVGAAGHGAHPGRDHCATPWRSTRAIARKSLVLPGLRAAALTTSAATARHSTTSLLQTTSLQPLGSAMVARLRRAVRADA